MNRGVYSGASTGVPWPDDGATEGFGNEYARLRDVLMDNAVLPLTGIGGTGDAVTATVDPELPVGGIAERMKFTIAWADANTGAVTLSVNGEAAAAVVDSSGNALTAGSLDVGLVSVLEVIGGAFHILSPLLSGGGSSATRYYQAFTSSGTWNKPVGLDPDAMVTVEAWGGGGGGGRNGLGGGGGGGGYALRRFRLGDLPGSVSVTVGAGGAGRTGSNGNGTAGGNTTFGALLTAYGGGGGGNGNTLGTSAGGGGGGELGAGGSGAGATEGLAGAPGGGSHLYPSADARPDARTVCGGGGGGGGAGASRGGGWAVHGGGGGGVGGATALLRAGGLSLHGGNGGDGGSSSAGSPGSAPGGGGGGGNSADGGDGARGEVRIWI
jgi:hypothetical protein